MAKRQDKITALTQKQILVKRINIWFGRELGDEANPYSSQKTICQKEIYENSIDAIRKSGKSGIVKVTFNKDGSMECYDNGSGIPTELSQTAEGKPASSLFLALGQMNAGSNYENMSDSLGTNGVGGSGAQFLSEYTRVEVYRDKKIYKLDFSHGEPGIFNDKGEFEKITDLTYLKVEKDNRPSAEKKMFPTGTKIKIKLNDDLFQSPYPVNIDDLIERMKGIAFLAPTITFDIVNHNRTLENGESQHEVFNFTDGLQQLIELNTNDRITDIYTLSNTGSFIDSTVDISNKKAVTTKIKKDIKVECAFTYSNHYDYFVDSYVNTIKTRLHGFHVDAFEKAFVQVMNSKLRSMRSGLSAKDEDPILSDYQQGLSVAVSVSIPEPEFTNQVKEELGGKKAQKEFLKLFIGALEDWVKAGKNQNAIKIIGDKVIQASKNRIKVRDQLEITREKNRLERSTSMPVKLVDCELKYDPRSELFIVEGDSALSGLREARKAFFQALIPIRGKMINALKAPMKTILANAEVQDIIKCLDAGVGADYDHSKARYGKVLIATDADSDGANISCLLTVLIYRLFPEIIEKGCLYQVLTPLFIINYGKNKVTYCYSREERDKEIAKLNEKNIKFNIVRAKGLGETGTEALSYTGMNPETRNLQRITIEDVEVAEEYLEITMGENVSLRKKWLEENPIKYEIEEEIGNE